MSLFGLILLSILPASAGEFEDGAAQAAKLAAGAEVNARLIWDRVYDHSGRAARRLRQAQAPLL